MDGRTLSSAVEHALHTGGVSGSIPLASTTPFDQVHDSKHIAKLQKKPQGFVVGQRVAVVASAFMAFVVAWQLAVFQFPETMHQVRLVLLLIATGGPGD